MAALVLRGVAILFGRWLAMCWMLVRQGKEPEVPSPLMYTWHGKEPEVPSPLMYMAVLPQVCVCVCVWCDVCGECACVCVVCVCDVCMTFKFLKYIV